MSDTPIVSIHNLTKKFGKFTAIDNVSLEVMQGDVFGFLGANGSGKSTTMRCLLGLIKYDSGSVTVFGKDLNKDKIAILRQIGSIIEKPDMYLYLSARLNLEIFGRLSGADISRKNVDAMLDFVGLKGRETDKLSSYSHGMKQRLGMAQALLHQPKLIILDEPTTGLDPQGIIDLRELILRLNQEQGITVMLSSHILSEIELIANRLAIINKGKIVVQGCVQQLLGSEQMVVLIETNNNDKTLSVLKSHFIDYAMKPAEGGIELHLLQTQIPELSALLVNNGLQVFGIRATRRLEDYFLKLTA